MYYMPYKLFIFNLKLIDIIKNTAKQKKLDVTFRQLMESKLQHILLDVVYKSKLHVSF